MYASVELLHGRGTAYAALITRRISTTSLQNPKFFRPELRSGLKQRQEAAIRERMQDKKKRWDDWEQQIEEEERLRREQRQQTPSTGRRVAPITRNDPFQQRQQDQYQQVYQQSETARLTKEQQLDDIQRRLQERVKQRQRRTDRWIPPQYAEDAVPQRAAEEQARAAAREARRQQEEERLRWEASDKAVAAQFLQGRVRQKASRFADLVESLQESKANKDPYRSRREDATSPVQMVQMSNEQQQQQQEPPRRQRRGQRQVDVVEDQLYTSSSYNNRNNDGYDQQESYPYLLPDVVRVQRASPEAASSSQEMMNIRDVIVESGEEGEEPLMVWTAGSEGLFQEPVRSTLEEAEYTDVYDVEEYSMEEEEEERCFQQQVGVQGQQERRVSSMNDEYIDW